MSAKKDIVIKLVNVSKKYTLHHEKPTFIERIFNGKNEEFYALKNINLKIKKGERVGIVGPNGSGKTTLLKLISGITSPTKGKVETYGKIVSLIDLEAGFHPDLSGIQNIYLNGTILGMSKIDIDRKINNIIEFADIGKFIDAQLFTYSEGMKLRLGFSIVAFADPDILILDENIAVGDEDFSQKTQLKIKEFVENQKTILLATHNKELLLKNNSKCIFLDKGLIKSIGRPSKILKDYLNIIYGK